MFFSCGEYARRRRRRRRVHARDVYSLAWCDLCPPPSIYVMTGPNSPSLWAPPRRVGPPTPTTTHPCAYNTQCETCTSRKLHTIFFLFFFFVANKMKIINRKLAECVHFFFYRLAEVFISWTRVQNKISKFFLFSTLRRLRFFKSLKKLNERIDSHYCGNSISQVLTWNKKI